MASSRLLGAARRALTVRLDQLQRTLEALGDQLREAVSQTLGQTIGSLVKETLRAALIPTEMQGQPYRSSSYDPYHSHNDYEEWNDPEEEWQRWEREAQRQMPQEEPKAKNRLPIAFASGLRAAAWWLSQSTGSCLVSGMIATGVLAGWVTYVGGSVVESGLRLAESIAQVTILGRTARQASSVLNR